MSTQAYQWNHAQDHSSRKYRMRVEQSVVANIIRLLYVLLFCKGGVVRSTGGFIKKIARKDQATLIVLNYGPWISW